MNESSLRELGMDLIEERQFERALAVFAEAVRRVPADHRSRMMAARCLAELGERERAVTCYHACAEGLLRRDYLLSAMAACKLALDLMPNERRLKDTLIRVHARAVRNAPGRAAVPPPLPPEVLYDGKVDTDLMGLQGEELSNRAIEVLAAADPGGHADPNSRPPLPLFAELDRDTFLELVGRMAWRRVKPEEVVITEGEPMDRLYVLVAGKAEVTRQQEGEPRTLGFLGGGSIFGEIALVTGAPPTATVTAVSDTEVFEIRREHLNAVAKIHPAVPQVLADFAQQRMTRNLMATSPMFQAMPESERGALLKRFTFRALPAREKVLVEGEHSPGLFLVLAGELVVQKEDPAGGVVTLGVLREGEVAGEISLLTGLRATATVAAPRKTAAAFLERSAFHELVKTFPNLRTYLEQLSDRRLKQIGEALRPAEIIDADELVLEPEAA
ncbi:cyclic nucleotide-binding domain-containing protein [Pyxidicoccus fallax]|uniref:Cyclic nucleotide-binding domain-containing protein n=1 Tax=Pyxidicoccus fallax TaxID=394095 RepID=A0A848LF08_9BACT|nr:cyclic nucleotide-binding domain-containing protein [Pyxidicoccus fallax]NMO17004.1 cyclic nucleotide-binding domain-containing protein [Pyxidicoccus fallax]NPC79445.1 cyclic nucleotide-binding domain-containing protein [Pyxidicoccus fallax]